MDKPEKFLIDEADPKVGDYIQSLQRELKEAKASAEHWDNESHKEVSRLQRENERLRGFAEHKSDCKKWRHYGTYDQHISDLDGYVCTCGLDNLLNKGTVTPPKEK